MQLFEDVYHNYAVTRSRGLCRKDTPFTADRVALDKGLPSLMTRLVAATGRDPKDLKVYGRAGELNRHFPKVPWVAVCYTDITTSTKRGYYIVLLFHEGMEGCFLSLNQGYTQFKDAFLTDQLALPRVEQSASHCLGYLEPRPAFVAGPIDLGASGDLGTGYERGAILSRWYPRSNELSEEQLGADLAYLLSQYERLRTFMGPNLALKLPAGEEAFQVAAASLAVSRFDWRDPPPGPVPVPPPVPGSKSTRYPRDPKVCARAQQLAEFQCEWDASHITFPRRKGGHNFVESHHLVPMSLQREFTASLDVIENIVALCPICHRLLHHGRKSQKRPVLYKLFQGRKVGLHARGVDVEFEGLLRAYATDLGGAED